MKSLKGMLFVSALLLALLNPIEKPALARGRVVVKVAPPAPRLVVARPACPYRNGVWVAGYWQWQKGKHVWIDGRWAKPKHGQVWVDGHWQNTPDGWEWIPGHWRNCDR
jgi:hypothetical protein